MRALHSGWRRLTLTPTLSRQRERGNLCAADFADPRSSDCHGVKSLAMSASDSVVHKMFDRALARRRLVRAQANFLEESGADFLLRRAADDLAERLSLVKRRFGVAVDLATPGPHAALALAGDARISFLLRAAPTAGGRGEGPHARIVADEERSPLADQSCDLIVSLLALQGVN